MTTAAPPVHITVPYFSAITEFVTGENDACGPCSNEVCLACCQHRSPSTTNMIAIRTRDINKNIFRAHDGQTLAEVQADVMAFTSIQTTITPLGSAVQVIHDALKAALVRGNPVVLNLANAAALPGNEPGVHYHFIAVGGIDTKMGYLIANGDHNPPSFGPVGTYWATWPQIAAAQPVGLLEYFLPVAPPPVVTPAPDITTALADLAAAETLLTKIKAELQR